MKTLLNSALLFSVMAGLAGCSTSPSMDYSKAGLVDVSGNVTLDGKPLADAVITFEAEDGQFSYAKTDSNGDYTLIFDSTGKTGVTPGNKIVRISTTRKILGLNSDEEGGAGEGGGEGEQAAAAPAGKELVPEKYNKDSELTADVKPDESQTFDFELKSA